MQSSTRQLRTVGRQHACACNAHRSGNKLTSHAKPCRESPPITINTSRRDIINTGVLMSSLVLTTPGTAVANPVADFIRSRQRANGGGKLLAPLKLAQVRLQNASTLLDTGTSEGIKAALQAVRASSLNCYIFTPFDEDTLETKASIVTQQLKLSDPCTFRIVVKNVTNFSPQYVKDQAQTMLEDLVTSYEDLDSYLVEAQTGNTTAYNSAKQQLKATLQIAADIEHVVAEVLQV